MRQKEKITSEEKIRIIESYLSGKIRCYEAERQAGVNRRTVYRWAIRYKMEGPEGFLLRDRNRVYSQTTKLTAVMDYLAGKGSQEAICKKYAIRDTRQLRHWLKEYNCHGDFKIDTGGSHMTKGRDTTAKERLEIVKACIANGNDYGGMALKYLVSYQQVYIWTKKYLKMGEAGLEDRRGHRIGILPGRTPEEKLRDRIAQLEREKFDLEMENALLKKVKELERRRH